MSFSTSLAAISQCSMLIKNIYSCLSLVSMGLRGKPHSRGGTYSHGILCMWLFKHWPHCITMVCLLGHLPTWTISSSRARTIFCSALYPKHLAQCLEKSEPQVNDYWIKEVTFHIADYSFLLKYLSNLISGCYSLLASLLHWLAIPF